jgi:3-methyladenine DNA glycosylase Tag
MTYCDYIRTIGGDQLQLHKEYHDKHYGFPIKDDDRLFERLMLEINQAGPNLEKLKNKNEEKGQTDKRYQGSGIDYITIRCLQDSFC